MVQYSCTDYSNVKHTVMVGVCGATVVLQVRTRTVVCTLVHSHRHWGDGGSTAVAVSQSVQARARASSGTSQERVPHIPAADNFVSIGFSTVLNFASNDESSTSPSAEIAGAKGSNGCRHERTHSVAFNVRFVYSMCSAVVQSCVNVLLPV